MAFRIKSVELYVRETLPGRMLFTLGAKSNGAKPRQGLINPLGHVRLILEDSNGNETFGCSADRLSVRWLDKRPGRSQKVKRRELVELIQFSRDASLKVGEFETPFEFWSRLHPQVMKFGRERNQEDLSSAFASALLERAVIDAFCRANDQSFFEIVKQDRLGIELGQVHAELQGQKLSATVSDTPRTKFWIRHTVGSSDPLTDEDLSAADRVKDGLPETLEEYIRVDGLRYFKIKVSGDPNADLTRLSQIWDVLVDVEEPVITLDANESYPDLDVFSRFVDQFEREETGMFQHVEYIEQPLPRALTLDPSTRSAIRNIAKKKPLLIDEADGTIDAYRKSLSIGYLGTSHKNCKGVFKSLCNHALVKHRIELGQNAFMSAEDLQNLPIVPLHQDFTTLSVLGIADCERNGHHYNYGLSMLPDAEKQSLVENHGDLYASKGDEMFLAIKDGQIECGSLQCPGFGVSSEPLWSSMEPLAKWISRVASV